MQKPSNGAKKFGIFLAYYMTWQLALSLTDFSVKRFLFLCWYALLCFVSTFLITYVVELFIKRPVFGARQVMYFPFKKALYLALPIVAALMLLSYFTVNGAQNLTTQRIITYVLGYVLGVGVVLYYIYGLKTKR